ncbi:MAG TPA: hypothetical protein VH083_26025 [Myxococcales bacterium]|nr:hypothetical protein [Myxococcales bacterium]
MNAPAAADVIHELERVPDASSGALVRHRPDGSMAGAMLVELGRVCWAVSKQQTRRLTDVIMDESPTLTRDQVENVVHLCRNDHLPLGETLIARGLVSPPVLRKALLRHTCEALEHLVHEESSRWNWVEHGGRGYAPYLTFSQPELGAGLNAREFPDLSAMAESGLRAAVGYGTRGFAVDRTQSGRTPLAQIGCEDHDAASLADLALDLEAALVTAPLAVAQIDDLACAGWADDKILYVLICDGDLAFNRLLAHVARTTNPTKE